MPPFKTALIAAATAATLSASAQASQFNCVESDLRKIYQDIGADLFIHLQVHYACNSFAERQVLNRQQVDACMSNYLLVKLQFSPLSNVDDLSQLSSKERALFHQDAFRKFKTWEAANPEQVQCLKPVVGVLS